MADKELLYQHFKKSILYRKTKLAFNIIRACFISPFSGKATYIDKETGDILWDHEETEENHGFKDKMEDIKDSIIEKIGIKKSAIKTIEDIVSSNMLEDIRFIEMRMNTHSPELGYPIFLAKTKKNYSSTEKLAQAISNKMGKEIPCHPYQKESNLHRIAYFDERKGGILLELAVAENSS